MQNRYWQTAAMALAVVAGSEALRVAGPPAWRFIERYAALQQTQLSFWERVVCSLLLA